MKVLTDGYTHHKQTEICGNPEDSGNGIQLNPALAGSGVSITAVGDDTNVPLYLTPKGAAAFGYPSGVGGAVTQATSKATGVTLNKPCGAITMNNASLAAGAEVAFTLTNSVIGANDVVVVSIKSGGTSAAYATSVTATAAGSCEITVSNLTAGALGEALVLNFVVIKGAAA